MVDRQALIFVFVSMFIKYPVIFTCGGNDVSAYLRMGESIETKSNQTSIKSVSHLNLSVAVGSEYCEHELSDASISSQLEQSTFRMIRSDRVVHL